MNVYRIGNIKVESESINELKEFSEGLEEMAKESGMDLSKHLSDACFAISVDYQRHHDLDGNNWEMVY